jgi:hypothetical protein
MAPDEPAQNDAAGEAAIKERLIETHSGAPRPEDTVQAIEPPGEPSGATPPQVRTASISPVPMAIPPATQPQPLPKADQAAAEPEPQGEPSATPRDPAAVETAMAAASLGLADLDPGQRAALKAKLVAGECASTALAELLGRAPVVATRDLVMNLENGC